MTEAAPTLLPPSAPRRPRRRFLLLGVVLAAVLAVGLFSAVGTSPTHASRPVVGGPAPSFTLGRLGGPGTVGTPADGGGNGRPAVLLFMASWCGPCQQEIPALAKAVRSQQAGGGPLSKVAVIGVDTLDPTANAVAFVKKAGVTFPVGADASARVTESLYAFTGDPEAVFIDGSGRIARIVYGPLTPPAFVADEQALLG